MAATASVLAFSTLAALAALDTLDTLAALAALGNKVEIGCLPKCAALPKVGEASTEIIKNNFVTMEILMPR